MKRIAGLISIAALLVFGTGFAQERQEDLQGDDYEQDQTYSRDQDYSGDQEFSGDMGAFTNSLSQYGEWVNTDYGSSWRPLRVGHHWRPYLNGHWAWTAYGWYWVSDEPFGWATFHYGRWTYDDYYGWIWIPGRVWGPAWVEWRYDNDYIGWAPLSPYARFSMNVGLVWSNHWVAPVHYWNFLSCRRFTTTRVSDYVEPIERTRRIFGNTRGAVGIRSEHNRIVNAGIDTRFIERRANVRISRVDVVQRKDASPERVVRDDRRTRIETYRPNFQDQGRNDRGGSTRGGAPGLQSERPSVMPRSNGTDRTAPRTEQAPRVGRTPNVGERGRERAESQKDAFYERRDQARRIQQDQAARNQEQRLENQQPMRSRERQMQSQQQPPPQERRVQEQPRSRGQEQQRVERGSQQSGRDRSPARPQQQQGEQRGRGRRPG